MFFFLASFLFGNVLQDFVCFLKIRLFPKIQLCIIIIIITKKEKQMENFFFRVHYIGQGIVERVIMDEKRIILSFLRNYLLKKGRKKENVYY